VIPRQIISVVAGLPGDSTHEDIMVTYDNGTTEHRIGSLLDASELAFSHGLTMVPTPDDTFRWERLRPPRHPA